MTTKILEERRSQSHPSRDKSTKMILLCCACLSVACKDENPSQPETEQCAGGTLEADLEDSGWTGPAVDPETGELRLSSGEAYMVSSTYGVPVPGPDGAPVTEQYLQLFTGIQQQLETQAGLLALQLGSSEACASGRTLAVWESEEAMYDFVFSPAHAAAMAAVDDVLKPGYGVTHWEAQRVEQISFMEGAQRLAREASGD